MSTLKAKAVNSLKWTTIQTIIVGFSGPLLMIFKARFLTPSEFGVLAILTIIIGLMTTIENFGISQAVIQKDKVTKDEQSTLFFFNLMLVTFLGGLLFISADIISMVFDMPELSNLVKIASFIIVLNGPSLLFRALLEKALLFKGLSLIKISRNMIMFFITLLFLYLGYGLTGIVYAQLIAAAIAVTLILLFAYRSKLINISIYFKFSKLSPFISFGIYVFGKQVMTFLTHRFDEVIIGLFLSNEMLGIYHFAKNMLESLRNLITSSFSKVLFPVFAKLKENRNRLTNAYIKISKYLGLLAFPIFCGIAVTAEYFVPVIFGDEWIASIPFFQIFSLIMIPLILTANIATSLLYSIGRPRLIFYIDLITNFLYLLLIILVAQFGVYAVLLSYGIYVFGKTIILQLIVSKELTHNLISYIIEYQNIIISSGLMAFSIIILQSRINNYIDINLTLYISIFTGILVYGIMIMFLERRLLISLLKDTKVIK